MARKRYLIIGDGAAGLTAAKKLRRLDPSGIVGIFSDEPQPGYYRAALTNYLLGELRQDQLWSVAPDFYEAFGIHRICARVTGLDAARSLVWHSASSTPTPYDCLLIASGSRPRVPSFPGAELSGVLTLRTLRDVQGLVEWMRSGRLTRAVVLGGGALGLEWAQALLEHRISVNLVERAPRFLPNALDNVASDLLASRLRNAGIQVWLGADATGAQPGPTGAVSTITLRAGHVLSCELIAAALGVVPNSEFLQGSGVALAENGGIVADARLRTNIENVWAAGDVARVAGEQLYLWEPAQSQGRVAAENMAGRGAVYDPKSHYFATRLFDLDFARVGEIDAPGAETLVDLPRGTGRIAYRKLCFREGRLVGALMLGERETRVRKNGRNYKRLIDLGLEVSDVKQRLLDPEFDFNGWTETRKLVAPLSAARERVSPAKLRGTQAIAIGGQAAPASGGTRTLRSRTESLETKTAALAARSAALSGPRGTRMLSIGLHAEAPEPPASAAPQSPPVLDFQGIELPLRGPVTSIGRAPDNQIALSDAQISARHAEIVEYGGRYFIRDQGSQSGTFVNQEPLTQSRRLQPGDVIRMGTSELRVRSAPEAASEPPRRKPEPTRGLVPDYRTRLAEQAEAETLACIGCNDCLLVCPIAESQRVTIAELNHAVHLTMILEQHVVDFVTACTQCRQCVPACPADLNRADMVLYNKLKVEDTVPDHELLLQAKTVTLPSGWSLDALAQSLSQIPVFAGSSEQVLRRLILKSTLRLLVAGEWLCADGEFHERLCVVLTGALQQTSRGPNGSLVPIVGLGPGSFFGELGVLGDAPEPFGVVANEPSIVLDAPKVAVLDLMNQSPAFHETLTGLYARRALWGHATSPGSLGVLPHDVVGELLQSSRLRMLSPGERLVQVGQLPQSFFLVRSGFLRAAQPDTPRDRVLTYFREGDVFGLLSLLHSEPASAYTVDAAGRAEVIEIPRAALAEVLSKHPDYHRALVNGPFEAERLARSSSVGHRPLARGAPLASRPETQARISAEALFQEGILGGREVLIIDQELCTSCGNCEDACERRHGYGRLQLRGPQVDNYLFPTACRHCEDPACLLCSVAGIVRLPSGEIKIVSENCIGCGACAERCPYGNISMHALEKPREGFAFRLMSLLSGAKQRSETLSQLDPKVQRLAVKCDLCSGYDDYACVSACPVAAAFRVDPGAALSGRS